MWSVRLVREEWDVGPNRCWMVVARGARKLTEPVELRWQYGKAYVKLEAQAAALRQEGVPMMPCCCAYLQSCPRDRWMHVWA